MMDKINKLNPGEAKTLRGKVDDLTEQAAKQALSGVIQVLSLRVNLPRSMFEDILDDAAKYSAILNHNKEA
jgi:hypothetical protein